MSSGPVTVFDKDGNFIRGASPDMPKQYIQGWVEWYKLKFKVTPDVLIPRPETELLVDETLNFVRDRHVATAPRDDGASSLRDHEVAKQSPTPNLLLPTIIDIGTGSGCIAISIVKNSPKTKAFAIDISEKALEVAKENAKKHRVDKKIFFLKSDLLSVIPAKAGIQNNGLNTGSRIGVRDDNDYIIVANLPYIPTSRISSLDPSVRDFEPRLALDGGPDGFNLYRELFGQMKQKGLIPQLFVGEIDESQEKIAQTEAKKYFPEAKIEVKQDLTKTPRILIIKY